MSVLKKIVRGTRDRFLGTLRHDVRKLGRKVDDINSMLLSINHNYSLILNELHDRQKNSGTLVLSETELITKIFNGLKMYLDPRDLAITPHLALDSIWEHRITAAWQIALKPGCTVMDIGSNNGYYGALAAHKMGRGKKSKVIMFEANPQLIPYIKKTLAVNWLNEQTTLENLAVADKPGKLTLHVLKDYIGSSSVHSNKHVQSYMKNKMYLETQKEVEVKAVTIDDYCKEHGIRSVDLMIMDIEGYEDKAYAGMRKTVAASPNLTLFVEFTKGGYEDPKGFYEQMKKDFKHVYSMDDEGHIIKPKNTSYEAIIGDSDDWVMPIFSKRSNLNDR